MPIVPRQGPFSIDAVRQTRGSANSVKRKAGHRGPPPPSYHPSGVTFQCRVALLILFLQVCFRTALVVVALFRGAQPTRREGNKLLPAQAQAPREINEEETLARKAPSIGRLRLTRGKTVDSARHNTVSFVHCERKLRESGRVIFAEHQICVHPAILAGGKSRSKASSCPVPTRRTEISQ